MRDRTVALGGIFQAARLVHSLANTGALDEDAFATSIRSIYTLDSNSVEDCYGRNLTGLKLGLDTIRSEVGDRIRTPEIIRYVFTLVHLERKLRQRPELLKEIAEGITGAAQQAKHLGHTHENVVAHLGDIYKNTVSQLSPRVMVHGNPLYLQQEHHVGRIRALLLAGIRSAVLWAQLGGRRWQLIFCRKRVGAAAERLAATL